MKTQTRQRTDRCVRAGVTRTTQDAYTAPNALPVAGANDSRHFARIDAALYVADPRTGKGVHLCDREQATLFAALNAARDNGNTDAAHLAARLDAI